ncbi:hypothetical protein FOZ63_002205, partial [Perkinsus olseni]
VAAIPTPPINERTVEVPVPGSTLSLSEAELIQFVKRFRMLSGNKNGTVYLVCKGEQGPIGISFNAVFDKATWSRVLDGVEDARRYASLDWTRNYTFNVDAGLDHTSTDMEAVDKFMSRADHVSVTTFSSDRTGMLEMDRMFLTSTCPHCNDDLFGSYKASAWYDLQRLLRRGRVISDVREYPNIATDRSDAKRVIVRPDMCASPARALSIARPL